MTKNSLPAIQRELQCLKKLIPTQAVCFTFIEETAKDSVFLVQENIYRSRAAPQYNRYEVAAKTCQEVVDKYSFPACCDNKHSIIFTYDFGE